MGRNGIPDIVIGRLPIYLRALTFLAEEGREVTSSQELGDRLGISSAQIRKDLSHFDKFGKQGTGYEIKRLLAQLSHILQVDHGWDVVLVGAGDLGHALVHYGGFRDSHFQITAVFDKSPAKIGQRLADMEIRDVANMAEDIRQLGIHIGIIAVPASEAQNVANILISAGVRALLNYAPITLTVPSSVRVQNVDPIVHMQRMTYYL